MNDQPITQASAGTNNSDRRLVLARGLYLFDNEPVYAIFAGDPLHLRPSSPWIESYLKNYFVSENTTTYNTISVEDHRSELLVYIAVSDLERISKDTKIAVPVIASFSYFASACAYRWLEEVSYGGIDDYVDTTEMDDCLANLRRFLEGLVSLTSRDVASDGQPESDCYADLAKSQLERLLGKINPKWKSFEFADFAADLEIVRRGSRKPEQGRKTLSHRADEGAAKDDQLMGERVRNDSRERHLQEDAVLRLSTNPCLDRSHFRAFRRSGLIARSPGR